MRRALLTATVPAGGSPNVQFGAVGTKAGTATANLDVPYPSGISAGHLLVCLRVLWNVSMTADDISGWDMRADGTSGTGTSVDAHVTRIRIDTKVASGSETGNLSTTASGIANGQIGIIARYTNDTGLWSVEGCGTTIGADTTHAADRSTGASGSFGVISGDMLLAGVAVDTDAAITATGLTITHNGSGTGVGTVTRRTSGAGVADGADGNVDLCDAPYTGGTQSGGGAFAWTTATSQCGPVGFVRIRQS